MREELRFDPLKAIDCMEIVRQPSQRTVLGVDAAMSWEEAEYLAAMPVAWTARAATEDGEERIIACFGLSETFPGMVGVGWAMLAEGLGAHHLRLTRFLAEIIASSPLKRIELIAPCIDIEPVARAHPEFDPWQLVAAAIAAPTREVRWAKLLGMKPAHVLRRFGAADESFLLFERIAV